MDEKHYDGHPPTPPVPSTLPVVSRPESALERIGYPTPDAIMARAMESKSTLQCPDTSPVNCAIRNPWFVPDPRTGGKCVPQDKEYLCFLENNPAAPDRYQNYQNLVHLITGGQAPRIGTKRFQRCITDDPHVAHSSDRDPEGKCVRDWLNAAAHPVENKLDLLPWVPSPASLAIPPIAHVSDPIPPGVRPATNLGTYYPTTLLDWTAAHNRQLPVDTKTGARAR